MNQFDKRNKEEIIDKFNKRKNKLLKELNKTKDKIINELNQNGKINIDKKVEKVKEEKSSINNNNVDDKKSEKAKEKENNSTDNKQKTLKKMKLDKKSIVIIILVLVIVIGGISSITNQKKQNTEIFFSNLFENTIEETIVEHKVKVHIDFTENLIFSRYDVILEMGNVKERITHGESKDFEFNIEEGTHTLYFINADDSSIKEEISLDVKDDMEIAYKISCNSDKISVTNLYIDLDNEIAEDEVEIKTDKSEFTYKNYKDVIKKLEELGFTNIVEKPMYDIVLGWTEEGEVDNVTIDGSDSYKRGDVFKKDCEVVVSYHLKESSDPSKIKAPYDTDKAKGVNYKDVVKAFKKAGFTNIKTEKRFEADFFGYEEDTVANIYINNNSFDMEESSFSPDDEVRIDYYVITKSGESNEKLSSYYAQQAFEKYGKANYPFGFKCHWWVGLIAEEQRSDGSWYFKVEVTITNAFGADYKTVAEGIVSGTDANPKVKQFYVSN